MLTVSSLSAARGGRLILDRLSFSVRPGRALILRGPNGAGKSTLLRCLAGLMPLAHGDATLDDTSLVRDRDGFQDAVAFLGHADALKPGLTLAENLGFWAALQGGGSVTGALAAFGQAALAERPAGACSAGQKRRAALARLALSTERLWLLDEPTVSLDADGVAAFGDLVRRHLARKGIAIIATHIDLGLQGETLTLSANTTTSADPFLAGEMT